MVNNAGVLWAEADIMLNTNFKGPKRVTDAFIKLIDKSGGRIVNVSSGGASEWLQIQDSATRKVFTNPDVSFEELEGALKTNVETENFEIYGRSKAGLCALTLIQARSYPNLKITSLNPGFVDTPMSKDFGAQLTPEQGCLSTLKVLFSKIKKITLFSTQF